MLTITVSLPISFEDWVMLQAHAPKTEASTTITMTTPPVVVEAPAPKTHADLREACRKARDRGVQLDAIRTAMGAPKVDDVPADKLNAAVAAVEGLK